MNGSDLLRPIAGVYGAAVRSRLELYRRGFFHVRQAGRPVISIGNVAVGGTGKTPFTLWLASELQHFKQRPSILTRGYGRSGRGSLLVSGGAEPIAAAREAGDEPALLARALPGVPILADADRVRGAGRVEALFPDVSVHLLDDGFSHVRLARNVDIVLLDATDPDAGGALLPAGRLREPLESLARADLIVITKIEQASPERALAVALRYAPGVPVYGARTEVLGVADDRGEAVHPIDLPPGTVVGVCGIARPDSFAATLESLGISPTETLSFNDHARYGSFRLGRILRTLEETGATAVVTTEKDAVKLEGLLPVPIYRVRIRSRVVESSFMADLLTRLAQKPS
ncbi:MAG: tetraacyldisaccharide 4'-kinase [Thermoanaerobaculia bacterium]